MGLVVAAAANVALSDGLHGLPAGRPDPAARPTPDHGPVPVLPRVRNESGALVGVNLTHHAQLRRCSLDDTGIVATYHRPGVRAQVQGQLAAMRRHGIVTLRLIVWHQEDAGGRRWGVVPSAGGRLSALHRANLRHYAADVRAARFRRLSVSLAPMGDADPRGPGYEPRRFEANWRVIREVRAQLHAQGPPEVRVDLLNEGAPPDWPAAGLTEQNVTYLASMYRRYVHAFGARDVTLSSTASQSRRDTDARISNLAAAVGRSGAPPPRTFEVHLAYTGRGARAGLETVDAALTRHGLRQPLVVGETAYDDRGVARAIARFRRRSSRPVEEVLAWPLTRSRPCRDVSVAPPYRADAYLDPE